MHHRASVMITSSGVEAAGVVVSVEVANAALVEDAAVAADDAKA